MREDFLHYLWRFKRFDSSALKTSDGENIEIIDFGEYNTNAGPDFFNSKIKIGETLWAGNVEMHLKSSEWWLHKHQEDMAYNNVILHVVLEEDSPVFRENGEKIPCLVLRPHIKENLLGTYQQLLNNAHWIPCQHHFYSVSEMTKNSWVTRLLIERLDEKTQLIEAQLVQNQYHWEETFYQFLSKNFGLKVNDLPFEMLAKSLPLGVIGKHKDQLFQVEALLLGQAGLLNEDFEDDYPQKLKKEYEYLSKKFQLQPMETSIWKFSRLRPQNFPSVRIAQFAALIHQSVHLFSKILETKDAKSLEKLFQVELSGYWETHFILDKSSKKISKTLGKETIRLFLINTIAPFLFLYGKIKKEEEFKDRAVELLEQLSPERNNIIEGWQKLGFDATSAGQTQGLIQLKNKYCSHQKCLDCAIGISIMKGV